MVSVDVWVWLKLDGKVGQSGAFFHPASDPALTNIVPRSMFYGYWNWTFFFWSFFQPWPPYYPTTIDVPSWPKLPTDNQCPSLTHPTHLSFIFSLVKCLHLVKTSISSSLNLYFSAKTFLLSIQASTSWQNFDVLLVKPLTFDKTSIFS